MKKPNKGPWKVIALTKSFEIFSEADECSICELQHDDQSEANANLIAAAPELLKALELAQLIIFDNFLKLTHRNSETSDSDAYHKICQAIAKARGDS